MKDIILIFQPSFLLHNALWGCIAVGFFCPVIGVYFMLRRMVLLGVALPQISASGISLAFFLQGLGVAWTFHAGEPNDRLLALMGSSVLTVLAILALASLERRGEGTTDSRIGATYAFAYAAAILFVSSNASGKSEMLSMLQGEVVSVNHEDLQILIVVYAVLAALLLFFNRQFVLVSYDRQSAKVMGKNVMFWDVFLYLIIGFAISIGVLIVGPMLTFAFLVVPPLAARRFCRSMRSFFVISSLLGGISAAIGFYLSYHLDWPLSPTAIAVTAIALVSAFLFKRIHNIIA